MKLMKNKKSRCTATKVCEGLSWTITISCRYAVVFEVLETVQENAAAEYSVLQPMVTWAVNRPHPPSAPFQEGQLQVQLLHSVLAATDCAL